MASIEKRGPNKYRLTVEAGYDTNGKRIRRRKTVEAKGITEARKLLAEFQVEVMAGEYITPEKMYFKDFIKEWEEKYVDVKINEGGFSISTKVTYMNYINCHILPEFGDIRLDQIKTFHLLNFFTKLRSPEARKDGKKKPLSPNTIDYIYRAFKNILDRAVEWKLINHNPISGISRPRKEKNKPNFYDEDEAKEVIKALYNEPDVWKYFFLAALLGGFRRGELIALEWPDVDFENNTFDIRKSISITINGQAVEGVPKAKSEGIVVMPEWYMEELKKYHLKWKKEKLLVGDAWQGGDKQYVFHGGLGKPFYYDSPSYRWRRFIERNGLRYIRLHDLRHTSATLLIEAGVDIKVIQERLRHANFQTTADIYTHITKRVSKATAEKFDKFDPKKNIK